MYVIFYNNKPIYLSSKVVDCDSCLAFKNDCTTIFEVLNQMDGSELNSVCFIHHNPDELFKKFSQNFKIIEAAGGVVKNPKQDLLFIFRNDIWDLPKGKIETGESIDQAALREVTEECGVANLSLGSFLDKTYHIYKHKGAFIFKITHWFKMSSDSDKPLIPQLEEGITKAQFLDEIAQNKALQNTYPNIKLLIENYFLTTNSPTD
ncbi:MAG: NUDIX domain-containing protein [Flavobacteriaceae bacterium]|nr:NUDIX domain-containing protein [Flavobacteriaceae bacterium]